jgi:competence protein ComEA
MTYFNFNRKEKVGVITFSVLIVVLTIVLNVGYSTYIPNPLDVDESKLNFVQLNEDGNASAAYYSTNQSDVVSTLHTPELHDFDPNIIAIHDWVNMGFSQKQAESIVNYRERFGPFKRKEDLKRVYVVSEKKYAEIEPYIKISNQENNDHNIPDKPIVVQNKVIELNTATLEELMSLRGIGEGYGNRIINYRNKIGGFVEFNQIETLSISDDAKLALKEYAIINPDAVQKTNINRASKDELKAIPFSNWSVVSAILKQRDLGVISNLDFLSEKEISTENKIKFELYLSF